jgi:hypothetical protein
MNDIDPGYYQEENHGYWLKSPDYEFTSKLIRLSHEACNKSLACWLRRYDPYSAIPF